MTKKDLIKKLVIGSANFTQKYGANSNMLTQKEIKKILDLARKNNIKKIDTAESYIKQNLDFKKIGKNFQYITKIQPNYKWTSLDFCQKKIEEHFNILNVKKTEYLLIHNSEILLSKYSFKIFKNLEFLRKKYFKKIGVSIYQTNSLNYLIDNFDINVIQCPYNILDKRILTTGWFYKLKRLGIETHVRSIFLQGLLVNKLVYKKNILKNGEVFLKIGFYIYTMKIYLLLIIV